MVKRLGDRINFITCAVRNAMKTEVFFEANHLDGDVDMVAVMKALVELRQRRNTPVPFRPNHGHQMLDDLGKKSSPSYSAIGRLRGLDLGLLDAMNTN